MTCGASESALHYRAITKGIYTMENHKSYMTKGISPLIAAVLLIAFTVAIATLIMGWFSTFTRTTTSSVTNATSLAVSCANARVTIRDVYIQMGVSGLTNVVVENTGYDTLTITGLQLYNTTGHNFSTRFSPVTNFTRGGLTTFQINETSFTSCGTFSKAVATTNCGGIGDVFTSAPKCS